MTDSDDQIGRAKRLGTTKTYFAGVTTLALLVTALLLVQLAPLAAGEAPGPIRLLTGRDASNAGVYKAMIDDWNDAHPDSPAELVELPGEADMYHAEMVRAAQSDHSGYDIYNIDSQWTAEFARAGWIEPVASITDEEHFLDNPLRTVEYDRTRWAVPFVADVGMIFYRKDLVRTNLRAEKDWPRLFRALVRETERARAEDPEAELRYAYTGQFDRYEGLTVNAMEFAWGNGGGIVAGGDGSGPLRGTLDTPRTAEGLRSIVHAMAEGDIPEDARFDREDESRQRFVNGEVLAMRNWPVHYDQLVPGGERAEKSSERGRPGADVRFEMMPFPPGMAALGGQSLAVTSDSERPRRARELIDYLTGAERQRRMFVCGGFAPVREDAYGGAFAGACAGEDGTVPDSVRQQVREERKYAQELQNAVEQARVRPRTPYYAEFTDVLAGGLHPLLAPSDGTALSGDDLRGLDRRLDRSLLGKGGG